MRINGINVQRINNRKDKFANLQDRHSRTLVARMYSRQSRLFRTVRSRTITFLRRFSPCPHSDGRRNARKRDARKEREISIAARGRPARFATCAESYMRRFNTASRTAAAAHVRPTYVLRPWNYEKPVHIAPFLRHRNWKRARAGNALTTASFIVAITR